MILDFGFAILDWCPYEDQQTKDATPSEPLPFFHQADRAGLSQSKIPNPKSKIRTYNPNVCVYFKRIVRVSVKGRKGVSR